MTTITPIIQKILFMLHPSVNATPGARSVPNDPPAPKVPASPLIARLRELGSQGRLRQRAAARLAAAVDGSAARLRTYRSAHPSIGLCADRATLRALALAYQQARLRGRSDAAARSAAAAAFLNRHPTAATATAEEAVALMLVVATAPDPQRATLRTVALAYREARHGGGEAAAAYEAAVDAYLARHPETPPLEAYGAVARMISVALERSPQWFWRGLSAPRSSDV